MYSTGTVTTTANSTKLVGTNTKWLNNINRVSAEQAIQIQINNTVYNNSIQSIQSDTELTLNFPLPTAATGAKYVILTTMVHSVSDAMNKIVSMNGANVQFSDILTRWMTEQGIITVTLPDQTTQQLRTTREMDKQLDGKLDKKGGTLTGALVLPSVTVLRDGFNNQLNLYPSTANSDDSLAFLQYNTVGGSWGGKLEIPRPAPGSTAKLMLVGDYGLGTSTSVDIRTLRYNGFFTSPGLNETSPATVYFGMSSFNTAKTHGMILAARMKTLRLSIIENDVESQYDVYHTGNTTKDSNGNLKAASPIVKVFADHIELNEESEGVEMEHLGIGHYLIKGVVGFNADGAWGINNGFVIPQDHNGKNMVLIDYEVRPDGDIEVFVFHQQNADMPERFQNKRIKHFDEEGVPVYFENYEPCDVPESRWIDMRVEMPPNSTYNQKQAEAERLAKIEAERLAQEEAKRAAEEAERVEQEVE
ncbi:hypothetical protein R8H71_003196 [Providencia rettgeri]|nr:hypothetical protein [Providencia rettgeri]